MLLVMDPCAYVIPCGRLLLRVLSGLWIGDVKLVHQQTVWNYRNCLQVILTSLVTYPQLQRKTPEYAEFGRSCLLGPSHSRTSWTASLCAVLISIVGIKHILARHTWASHHQFGAENSGQADVIRKVSMKLLNSDYGQTIGTVGMWCAMTAARRKEDSKATRELKLLSRTQK